MKSALAGAIAVTATMVLCAGLWASPTSTTGSVVSVVIGQADRPQGGPPPPGGRRAPWPSAAERERVRVRIGLTKAQGKQIEQLHEDTEREKQVIVDRMRELYRQLRTLYDQYSFDRKKAEQLRKQILALHQRRLELFGQNEERLRKILSPEQFARMRALMQEEWQKREHRPGRHPGGGDDMPPPGRGR